MCHTKKSTALQRNACRLVRAQNRQCTSHKGWQATEAPGPPELGKAEKRTRKRLVYPSAELLELCTRKRVARPSAQALGTCTRKRVAHLSAQALGTCTRKRVGDPDARASGRPGRASGRALVQMTLRCPCVTQKNQPPCNATPADWAARRIGHPELVPGSFSG